MAEVVLLGDRDRLDLKDFALAFSHTCALGAQEPYVVSVASHIH